MHWNIQGASEIKVRVRLCVGEKKKKGIQKKEEKFFKHHQLFRQTITNFFKGHKIGNLKVNKKFKPQICKDECQ